MRKITLFLIFTVIFILSLLVITEPALPDSFQRGDVFAAVSNGQVQHYDSAGNLLDTLDCGYGGYTTGMAFGNLGNLYVTEFSNTHITIFSGPGDPHIILDRISTGDLGDFHCESIVFDKYGNFYVGHTFGKKDIHKYNPAGNRLAVYDVATENTGSDWIELSSDQKTIFYTSEGRRIMRFDVNANVQLPDFAVLPDSGRAFALKILPDGGVLVADMYEIKRLDASGSVVQIYDVAGENTWFCLNLDPDTTSFWAGNFDTGMLYKFDIASGTLLQTINTGEGSDRLWGVTIFGEITSVCFITVTSPNGGEDWCAGSTQDITWTSVNIDNVKIEYSINGGSNWMTVVGNIPAVPGSYSWTVPNTPSTSCLVKICDAEDGTPCGQSDAVFTISPEAVTVTAPNGGENWCVDSTYNITWTCNSVDNAKIEYSTNGGSTWMTIIASTPSVGGSYAWTVPNTPSSNCLVKICDAVDNDPCDQSDDVFTIEVCEVAPIASIPDTCVYQGMENCIPIYLDSLPSGDVTSAQMVLLYDANVITATSVTTSGTIAQAWGALTYNIGPGWIAIDMAGTMPLTSTGVLVWVCFDAVGAVGDTTLFTFEGDQITLNDSTFKARGGIIRVCPEEYDICGQVRYCLNDEPVDGAQMMISGGKDDTVYTDGNGFYQFTNLPAGLDYVVRGDKADDDRGAISAFDASLALRYVVGVWDLSACQMIAGDVSGNCGVSAYDASFILRYVVGLITQFPVGKDWKFIPDDFPLDTTNWCTAPDSMFFEDLSEDFCCEDWKGLLYGDLSGNWDNVFVVGRDHPEDVLSRLVVKDISVNPGEEFVVPIQVEDIFEVYSAELNLSYDNALLSLVSVAQGELLSGYYFEKNLIPGEIRLALAGASPIQGSGELVNLTFKVLPQAQEGMITQLEVSRFCLNEVSAGGLAFNISISYGTATHPMDFSLFQNYPNPFNPETIIQFSAPQPTDVKVEIVNILGQKVVTLVSGHKEPGNYQVRWDGTDSEGITVANGLYFYRLVTDGRIIVKKMLLIK